jgi:2-dehydro-3-deoxyphosphooctonate aldolase (KDO 8-P synthase)
LSDGPNAWPLGRMRALLETLKQIDEAVKTAGFPERDLMQG